MFATLLAKLSQTPLIVLAGVLAALLLAFGMIAWRRGLGRTLVRFGLSAAVVAVVLLLTAVLMNVVVGGEQVAGRQALLRQTAELDRSVLTPGSILACVDGSAGETVGNACEKTVFATAQSAATAVAYIGARIDLLKEARAVAPGDRRLLIALAGTRRTVALDRYGIAAHVLAERDGCTAKSCAIFAMLDHVDALKSNLRAQAFDQYVSRYAASWGEPTPAAPEAPAGPIVSALPAATPRASAAANNPPAPETPAVAPVRTVEVPSLPRPRVEPQVKQTKREPAPSEPAVEQSQAMAAAAKPASAQAETEPPKSEDRVPQSAVFASAKSEPPTSGAAHTAAIRPGEHWDFPSAESIPAISIMAPEPKLSKDAAARLAAEVKKTAVSNAGDGKGTAGKPKRATEKTPKHPKPGEPLPLR